jgi:hypothetical protein
MTGTSSAWSGDAVRAHAAAIATWFGHRLPGDLAPCSGRSRSDQQGRADSLRETTRRMLVAHEQTLQCPRRGKRETLAEVPLRTNLYRRRNMAGTRGCTDTPPTAATSTQPHRLRIRFCSRRCAAALKPVCSSSTNLTSSSAQRRPTSPRRRSVPARSGDLLLALGRRSGGYGQATGQPPRCQRARLPGDR